MPCTHESPCSALPATPAQQAPVFLTEVPLRACCCASAPACCVTACLLRWLPPQLEEFDRQSQAKLSGMSASDVSLLLEAFRTYGYAPSQAWLQEFAGG